MPHTLQNILLNVIFIFEKGVYRLLVGDNGTESHSSYLNVHDAVFNFFYIWFQRASQKSADSGKKLTVILTCSFISKKKFEFLHLFSESFPFFKTSWLRTCKTFEIRQRYLRGYFWDSNSFCRRLKQQLKMFR